MSTEPFLIVVPAFNEAQSLPQVLSDLKKLNYPVLVVDDGSADETRSVANRYGIKTLRLPMNLGVGGALRAGFRYAVDHGYSAIVQVDADGQHPVEQIDELVHFAAETNAHLAIGSRYLSQQATLSPSLVRKLPMRLMSFLASVSSGVKITDVTSGFRVIREPLLSEFARVFPVHYLGDTYEATISAGRSGYRISEMPAALRNRKHGESSAGTLRAILLIAKVLLSSTLRLNSKLAPLPK